MRGHDGLRRNDEGELRRPGPNGSPAGNEQDTKTSNQPGGVTAEWIEKLIRDTFHDPEFMEALSQLERRPPDGDH